MLSLGWCPMEHIADQPINVAGRQASSAGPLVHRADLGGGVRIDVDLLTPGQWRTVSFGAVDDASGPLLRALLGEGDLSAASGQRLAVDPAGAAPWLRVAVVDALDRWLHTPLDQSVVDAERAVSRGRAARTLPDGPARASLVGDALRLARRASRDLAAVLRRLSASPVPPGLRNAVQDLVDGYAELADEIHGRRDRELKTVLDSWRRREAGRPPPAPPHFPAPAPPRWGSLIDPRQVRARVLGLSADPREPEISLSPTADGNAVLVRVPTFAPLVDADVRARLVARLINKRSGCVKRHAPMTWGADGFATTVPLCGLDPAEVRADVFDEWSDLPPARTDTDPTLREARRAVTFLAQWRRLAGAARLGVASPGLAGRLHDLADRLRPGFPGGPSPSDLDALAALGDRGLLRTLRGPRARGPFATTRGAAGLLVAELVALYVTP